MELFWSSITPRDEPVRRRWFLPVVALLILISVPWYLPQGFVGGLPGGLPLWVWVTLACSVALSCLTCWMAIKVWRDDVE